MKNVKVKIIHEDAKELETSSGIIWKQQEADAFNYVGLQAAINHNFNAVYTTSRYSPPIADPRPLSRFIDYAYSTVEAEVPVSTPQRAERELATVSARRRGRTNQLRRNSEQRARTAARPQRQS